MDMVLRGLGIPMGGNEFILVFTLALARSVPMIFLNPFLGGEGVPARVKITTCLALTLILFPNLVRFHEPVPVGLGFGFLLAKELAIGATLGFLTSIVFWGFASAGRLVDTQRGANMAETMVYQLRDRTSFMGQLYLQLAVVIFLISNGHHVFLQGYFRSFEVLPVWSYPAAGIAPAELGAEMARLTGNMLAVTLQLSAPVVLAVLLTDIGFGILNRASPQMNVFFLSQPVKMFLGVLMVIVVVRILVDQFNVHGGEMLRTFFRFISYLGG